MKKKESRVKLMLAWLSSKLGCRNPEENLDRLEQNKNKEDPKDTDAILEANKNQDREQLEENINKDKPKEKKDNLEGDTDKDNQKENTDSLEMGKDRNHEKTEDDENQSDTMAAYLQNLEDAHIQFARITAETSNHEDVRKEIQEMKDRISDLKNGVITGDVEKETPLWDAINEEGDTCLHISTHLSKPEATRMLLEAGADVNIENAKGETALHNACRHGGIEEATSLIKKGANLVPNKNNEVPALENLLFETQDIKKVNNLMAAIHKSNHKVKFLKTIFQEYGLLFKTKNPALIRAVVDTDKPDEDIAYFANLQDPTNNNKTGLHLACQRGCHAAASWLLKAGGYKLKTDGDALTPSLETFFTKDKSSKMTEFLVKGLIKKTKMNLISSEKAITFLQKEKPEGATYLSLVKDTSWYDELAAVDGFGIKIAGFAPTMGAEFAEWLLAKAEKEDWEKKSVYEKLVRPYREGKIALAHLADSSVWNKVEEVVGAEEMAKAASYMGAEFAFWLLAKTEEENFENKFACLENMQAQNPLSSLLTGLGRGRKAKTTVLTCLTNVNYWGKTALAHFADSSTWEKVAAVVGPKIAKSVSAMGPEFTEWLLVHTQQEEWDEKQVYTELIKVNNVGKVGLAHCADSNTWEKVTAVVGVEIAQSVSAMGKEFLDWLLEKTEQEGTQQEVCWKLIKVNKVDKAGLAHFSDSEAWDIVASVVGENIAESAVAMPFAFTEWLVRKTEKEKYWKKDKVYQLLCEATPEHKTALSSIEMPMPIRTKLSTWAPRKGLHFRVDNKELAEALKSWHTTLADVGEEKEKAKLVRSLIEKKGVVVVNHLGNGDDLESAVKDWNERNEQLSERFDNDHDDDCTHSFIISFLFYSLIVFLSN